MQYSSAVVAFLAASGAMAAPAQQDNRNTDIIVRLSGPGVATWEAQGFSATVAKELSTNGKGPFTKAQVFFSDRIKQEVKDIEVNYRCALERGDGTRVIVTRGENIDFNFGDGNNPNAWDLKGDALKDGKIKCDPKFKKVAPADKFAVRVTLTGGMSPQDPISFDGSEQTMSTSKKVGAAFRNVQLFVGPGVANQALRCQLKAADKNIILVDRAANKNKKTFGDGGKGAWTLDVAGDGIARVETVTCDPNFKNE